MSEPVDDPNSGVAPMEGPETSSAERTSFETRMEQFLSKPNHKGHFMALGRLLVASNPFYPVSAALLLYGFYRVSADTHFLPGEVAQLIFNFSSLQVYELLLVITAVFLARRCVWYDSMLLVGLENMLAPVAFILVSQAALIDRKIIWIMCLAAGILALLRFSSLKRFIAELNLPAALLYSGVVLLVANVALPVVFRTLHEYKVGTKPTWGAAYETNAAAWLVLLPGLCALANWIPGPRDRGDLWPQRWWLPMTFFALWIAGTVVHLYCLGYVYDFDFRPERAGPALWLLLWIACRRAKDFIPTLKPVLERCLLIAPIPATLTAVNRYDTRIFFYLTLLNVACYCILWVRRKEERLPLHLGLISVALLCAGVPQDWIPTAISFTRFDLAGIAIATYALFCCALSTNPKLGVLGGLILGIAMLIGLHNKPMPFHWASQAAMVFLLIHSLRWDDSRHESANAARVVVAVLWAAHCWLWALAYGAGSVVIVSAGALFTAWLLARLLTGEWKARILSVAAVVAALATPSHAAVPKLQHLPSGPVIVGASFLLFALGTGLALMKRRSH